MSSELMKYSTGEVVPPRVERRIAKAAKQIYDQTRLLGFEADAQAALTGHIMEKAVEIVGKGRELAGDDVALDLLLSDIARNAVRNLKRTQDRLGNGWQL